ncbi:MAG: hypothetical protein WCK49_05960 [Myxococcaceae bacterium]
MDNINTKKNVFTEQKTFRTPANMRNTERDAFEGSQVSHTQEQIQAIAGRHFEKKYNAQLKNEAFIKKNDVELFATQKMLPRFKMLLAEAHRLAKGPEAKKEIKNLAARLSKIEENNSGEAELSLQLRFFMAKLSNSLIFTGGGNVSEIQARMKQLLAELNTVET